ncbi:hypothetical protein KSD_14190 [Ktedonobacter sp. SOSP1-85]|uniref:Uma2 family endonuclease n=1 Tax=Ktedonobacter sp. SOSP1-85 TaxID=2778367 RepID=UPI001A215F4B|nr:Uma2 family endonuclease [Ktedonobacter sp. SOSP1-85]GHO73648.1 hypothetical protein KSD_14190 [Ktedonobacter sp. SOSP1-85]
MSLLIDEYGILILTRYIIIWFVLHERQGTMTTFERSSVLTPADWISGPRQGQWTYAEYAALPDDGQRYEIMDGVLLMAPSPTPSHQTVVKWLTFYLTQCVDLAGLGTVFTAPLDVELAPNRVVQPDVFVLRSENLGMVTPSRVVGALDLVIEVTSPGTAAYDRLKKLDAYAQAGVSEYWIISPEMHTIEVLVLYTDGYHSQGIFMDKDTLPSQLLPTLSVTVGQFFA